MNGDPYNTASSSKVVKLGVKKRPEPKSGAWENIRKIARMAGYNRRVRVDPVQVAASTLEKARAGRIKSIFVSIIWDDDTLSCDWSEMKRSALIGHAFNVQAEVQEEVHKP